MIDKRFLNACLMAEGWTVIDSTAIARKIYPTAVGPKVAHVYLSSTGTMLTADYQSEGRNVAGSAMGLFPKEHADQPGWLVRNATRDLVARFTQDVNRLVEASYAARLLPQSAAGQQEPWLTDAQRETLSIAVDATPLNMNSTALRDGALVRSFLATIEVDALIRGRKLRVATVGEEIIATIAHPASVEAALLNLTVAERTEMIKKLDAVAAIVGLGARLRGDAAGEQRAQVAQQAWLPETRDDVGQLLGDVDAAAEAEPAGAPAL